MRFAWAINIAVAAVPAPSLAEDAYVVQKLHASDGSSLDYFGSSVAIDAGIAVVGASWDDKQGTQSGSAYVFRFDGESWNKEQKLLLPDGEPIDVFGFSVAVLGDTIVVGAPGDGETGSAHVYRFDGSTWTRTQQLVPSNAEVGSFGRSVAMTPDIVVVGAPHWSSTSTGSAFVYHVDGSAWIEAQELVPADGDPGDFFGQSVAVSGELALVGAVRDDDLGLNSGAAYVFRRVHPLTRGDDRRPTWIQEAKLLPSDGSAVGGFGRSVSIDGDVALIGAGQIGPGGGAGYVFRRDAVGLWFEEQILEADTNGGADFAFPVTVVSDTALLGARYHRENGTVTGAAFLFRFDGANWCERQKLLPSELEYLDVFGVSVAIDGDTAFVGAIKDDDKAPDAGAVWVYGGLDEAACSWDLDGDGTVGILDLFELIFSWGPCDCCPADFGGNSHVGILDFFEMMHNWGPCPQP